MLDAIGADGCVPVPDGPGLGVHYDRSLLRDHAVTPREVTWGCSS